MVRTLPLTQVGKVSTVLYFSCHRVLLIGRVVRQMLESEKREDHAAPDVEDTNKDVVSYCSSVRCEQEINISRSLSIFNSQQHGRSRRSSPQ